MTIYSEKLSHDYYKSRDKFVATNSEVFSELEKMGLSGKNILDYGCGDGRFSYALLEKGAKSVVGIDVSPAMIDLAMKRLSKESRFDISFIQADGLNLPFVDETFDVVFSNFVLHHFENVEDAFREIRRVLRKGGVLVATMSTYEIKKGSEDLLNTEVPLHLGQGEDFVIVRNLVKSFSGTRDELINSGLRIVDYKSIDNRYARIDDSYPHTDKLKKMTSFIIARK